MLDGEWPVERQIVHKGNYLTVEDPKAILEPSGAFTIYAFVWPTSPRSGRQVILSRRSGTGYALAIDNGRLAFTATGRCSETTLHLPVHVEAKTWFLVTASADPETGKATLRQRPVINRWNSLHARTVPWDLGCERTDDFGTVDPGGPERRFLVGAEDCPDGEPTAFYNGKIDRFGLATGVLLDDELNHLALTGSAPAGKTLAHWDPTIGYTEAGIGSIVSDLGPHALHAVGINRPVRGQTGWNWGGRNDSFRLAPVEYGGVEFHDDALADCNWKPSIEFDVLASMRPGVYALKLTATN